MRLKRVVILVRIVILLRSVIRVLLTGLSDSPNVLSAFSVRESEGFRELSEMVLLRIVLAMLWNAVETDGHRVSDIVPNGRSEKLASEDSGEFDMTGARRVELSSGEACRER